MEKSDVAIIVTLLACSWLRLMGLGCSLLMAPRSCSGVQLSTSWDRRLLLQDESPPDEGKLIKAMPCDWAWPVAMAARQRSNESTGRGAKALTTARLLGGRPDLRRPCV